MKKNIRFVSIFVITAILCTILPLAGSVAENMNTDQLAGDNLFMFEYNDKWGYMDREGNVIIKPQYKYAKQFSEGLASVGILTDKGYKYGYINPKNETVIPFNYKFAGSFEEGSAVVRTKSFDWDDGSADEWISSRDAPTESYAVDDSEDVEYVTYYIRPNGKYFLKIISPTAFGNFSEGLASVSWSGYEGGGGCDMIDKNGKIVISTDYYTLGGFHEGLAAFEGRYESGFIDKTGKEVITGYKYNQRFSEGVAPVECKSDSKGTRGKWLFIDKNNNVKIKLDADVTQVHSFSEGVAAVQKGGYWGMIDHSGKFVVEAKYDYLYDCRKGLIMVQKRADYEQYLEFSHYIDLNGNEIRPKI